jgi:cell division protein FtsQ
MGRIKRSLSARSQGKIRRRPARSRLLSKKVFLAFLLCLMTSSAAGGLAAWTRTAPLFKLSTIDVGGNRLVPSKSALEIAMVEKDINIFAVDLEAIKEALERDPRILEVTIRRELPSRIVITIRERKPVLLLSASQLYGLDQDGMVIPVTRIQGLDDIPVLTGTFSDVQSGVASKHVGVQKGLEIRQAILETAPFLLDQISEINVSLPEAPLLYLVGGGAQVDLGSGNLRVKLRRLWTVLEDQAAQGISIQRLDLRFKNQVVCQPVG